MESFFSSLKKERIGKRIFETRDMAPADVFDYIKVFYYQSHRHSHLGGVSPEAFERAGREAGICLPEPGRSKDRRSSAT